MTTCYFDDHPLVVCKCGGVMDVRYTEETDTLTNVTRCWVWLECKMCRTKSRKVQGMGMDVRKELERMKESVS